MDRPPSPSWCNICDRPKHGVRNGMSVSCTCPKPPPVATSAEVDTRWRHKKRGSTYVVRANAGLQMQGQHDGTPVVVYESEDDKRTWVRPLSEFLDGRFEPLTIDLETK